MRCNSAKSSGSYRNSMLSEFVSEPKRKAVTSHRTPKIGHMRRFIGSAGRTGTEDLVELANDAQPKMLVLYHTQNWHQPYDEERLVAEMKRKGYEGAVVEARDTDVF